MTTIGFIGLGHMGHPMAQNLLKAGFKVFVHDVVPDAVQSMTKEGAIVAHSLGELAQESDVIITSVQTGQQVVDICLPHDGIFSHIKAGKLFIDCSSIDIATTHMLHEEAEKLHISMLDAPVSGGVAGAQAATLTFMVGGSSENFERAKPVLQVMGKKIVHAGASGSGQTAKICNNLLLGISMVGVCEAFALADKLGLDQKKFFDISSSASGQCWAMTSYCPVPGIIENAPSNNQYKPGFMAKMMLKDLRLAHHAAEAVNAAIPLGAAVAELYELYVNQGFGETDFSGILQFISNQKRTD
ncbi:3-hydroxyisobutyrate dehydrogenase [Aquicella siphonis]|uniref:3-hydroxyisobutyrate dehydrogenase n=1 Tax=Aquicella siphonis TaxID=254247 RepID=A0A5E4PLB8_9COXI|nr:3-hydroxyisobutyrate dehydrogenase [Aquicella siphonis]VVC77026.1 3-hydroxyisobutyrate dehydrogenase [Aquicella siphonis]